MDNDPVTEQALLDAVRAFAESLDAEQVRALLSGSQQLALAPAPSGQTPTSPAVLLATAVDSGDAADLAAAIKSMRAHGWYSLATDIGTAFATRVLHRSGTDGTPCGSCGHAQDFHTPDLGCWLCDCASVF